MCKDNRTVTMITEPGIPQTLIKSRITEEQLKLDYNYFIAQKMLKAMLEKGLISEGEFNKITEKNRKTFSPYLAELMS